MKTTEKNHIQGKLSTLSVCLKAGHKFVKVSPSFLFLEGQKLITGDNSRP